jgi:3-oxoacyl-[acyl-carrier protein] reductase
MTLDSGLAGKVAVVTGGSRGIGRAIVLLLAAEGVDVTFFYRENATAAGEVVAAGKGISGTEPPTFSGNIAAEKVDIRDSQACAAAVERVAERCGRIDILVNNAGMIRDNQLAAMDDDDVTVVLDTNVGGVFNVVRAVAPHMIVQRSGKIINLSSVAGEKGGRGQTNYAASKGAINAFTRALAVELAPRNITVNAVAPGVIETEMSQDVREMAGDTVTARILLKRYGKPEEVAYAVWFLASRFADYVTGQIINIDGGFKME